MALETAVKDIGPIQPSVRSQTTFEDVSGLQEILPTSRLGAQPVRFATTFMARKNSRSFRQHNCIKQHSDVHCDQQARNEAKSRAVSSNWYWESLEEEAARETSRIASN